MATGFGFWSIPSGSGPAGSKARSAKPKKQRKHHYTFDVEDNGLDFNGFILHTDKHEGKRHKFRVYLDSNENGRFDKNDELIGRTGIRQRHAAKGVGNLLDDDEIGQLEIKFKRHKSNASMRGIEEIEEGEAQDVTPFDDTSQPQPQPQPQPQWQSFSFSDSGNEEVVAVDPTPT